MEIRQALKFLLQGQISNNQLIRFENTEFSPTWKDEINFIFRNSKIINSKGNDLELHCFNVNTNAMVYNNYFAWEIQNDRGTTNRRIIKITIKSFNELKVT